MHETLHESLIEKIKELKAIVKNLALKDLVSALSATQRTYRHILEEKRSPLHSPYQQSVYLLSLAVSYEEPESPKELDNETYYQIIRLLNEIFSTYAINYFDPENSKSPQQTKLVMTAFFGYFFTGMNMSTQQLKNWIKYWFSEYTAYFLEKYNFSVEDLIDLGERIEGILESNMAELAEAYDLIAKAKEQFDNSGHDPAVLDEIKADKTITTTKNFYKVLENLFVVPMEKLNDISNLQEMLSVIGQLRGSAKEITYITEEYPLMTKPIIMDSNNLYFVVNNLYYVGILNFIENDLYKIHKDKARLLQERDNKLERRTEDVFNKLIGEDAIYISGCTDKSDGKVFEHDLLIIHGRTLLIIEAKASAPKEPMRDVDKAFVRIRDHFRSSSGLQKAFDQANGFKNRLIQNEKVEIFKKNKKVIELTSTDFDNIYCLCITRNDYGGLGCNIDLLLDKNTSDFYPWVADISNLEHIIQAWEVLNLGPNDFYKFLEQRQQVYGKVIGTDELEYVGSFLTYHNGLQGFVDAKADMIPLPMEASDVFDQIDHSVLCGTPFELKKQILNLQPLQHPFFQPANNFHKRPKNRKSSKMQKKSRKANRK